MTMTVKHLTRHLVPVPCVRDCRSIGSRLCMVMRNQFMARITFILICLMALAGGLHAASGDEAVDAIRGKPNIVLIMADDMGFSDIGCYGGELPTPNLDRLASGGLRFTQFYNTARCCPTRASLLTGLYPHEAGMGWMAGANRGPGYLGHLNSRCVTIARVLKTVGYRTMMTGKWHAGVGKGNCPTDRGFERFYGMRGAVDSYFKVLGSHASVFHNDQLVIPATADPPNTLHPDQEWYTTDVYTDWALKFMDEAAAESKPFFLYLAYNAPHWPLEAPEENIAHFRGKYLKGWDKLREEKLARMKKMEIVHESTELPPSRCPRWDSLPEQDRMATDFRRAIYAAQIERMDENIGRVVAKLKEQKSLDNTLILFLSDNGCSHEGGMFGFNWKKNRVSNYNEWRTKSRCSVSQGQAWAVASNAPFRKYKMFVHEGGIATPLIAHWPRVIRQRGKLTDQVGHVIDVMATCVEAAGASYPDTHDGQSIKPAPGRSLIPVFRGGKLTEQRTIYWEHQRNAAIREGDWKLVSRSWPPTDPTRWELYDLSTDRTEVHDQAREKPELVERLHGLWIKWARQANVLPAQ